MNARSYLFVPGDSERKIAKGDESGADALIYDLEDAVMPDRKATARALVRNTLREVENTDIERWVRINPLETADALPDLSTVVSAGLGGIVLPKVRRGEDVTTLCHYLSALEARDGLAPNRIRILVIATETPDVMFRMGELAGSSPRLAACAWGAEDLSAELGAQTNKNGAGGWDAPYEFAKSLCLFAAVAGGIQPVDTVYTDFRDDEGLRATTQLSQRQGFTGKIAIHPRQVPIINDAMTPSAADIAHAQAVVKAFENAGGSGAVSLDGKMIDIPHQKQALRILERAARMRGDSR